MSEKLVSQRDLDFQMYEFLDVEALLKRTRYSEHTRETFDASMETARKIAEELFANHNAKLDANEPEFDGEKVSLIPEVKEAWDAFAEAGFLAAHHDFEDGGMQLPEVVMRSCFAYFQAANVSTAGYPFLTIGAANLVKEFGSDAQREKFLPSMLDGRFSGTMALTEPGQGSALADIKTQAEPTDEDGVYRIKGQKMFISGGDHELTDNIVHMVLAKIKGAPAGVKGISLFICPKFLVNDDGSIGERNDVALAGLLHKMGYRGTTSTVLSFGEKEGAVGYLVGEPHKGLQYMFQMMNEARIGVGSGAAMLGYAGYLHSLEYARERPQGRLPTDKNPESDQVAIVEHADVRRMLLAQKAYAEGALSLCMYGSYLVDEVNTADSEDARKKAYTLLDLLTPVIKSWPSRYCLVANDLAIQILGGSGYIREYPVEQYYRDNRLNPIHEGTEGIQSIDLLARKLPMGKMAGYRLLCEEMAVTIAEAKEFSELAPLAESLEKAIGTMTETSMALMKALGENVELGLANANTYLDLMGRVVMSWNWLGQAVKAEQGLAKAAGNSVEENFYRGKIQAAKYYVTWELPQIDWQAQLLQSLNPVTLEMQNDWF